MSEEKVIIEEPQQEEKIEISTEGLSLEEIKAGRDAGIIPKEEKEDDKTEEAEVSEKKEEEPAAEEKQDEDSKPLDPADFDQMEEAYNKDEKKFHKNFTSNAKALYFKHKRNKQLRQEAQEALDEAQKEKEFLSVQTKSYQKQLSDIEALIDRIDSGDENITTADIRKVIAFKKAEQERKEESKPEDKKAGPDEKQKKYLAEKEKNTDLLGRSKYEDFDRYIELAKEVVDKDRDLADVITRAYINPEVDEEQLVEKIVKVARTHPKFGEKPKEKKDEQQNDKIDRIVANANKKKSSAALTTGSGRREIGYDDLTVEDVSQMSQKQWNSLPDNVRERLMKAVSK